jgi:hypothetical protein
MPPLVIPPKLTEEFATVLAVWNSGGETRRVDSLLLSWIKYEKQLRRLFCFLVFQHPEIDKGRISELVDVLADNGKLYPHTHIAAIAELGVKSVRELLGARYDELAGEMRRIKDIRNKLMHGLMTGMSIKSPQIEHDVRWIVRWMDVLADAADGEFGYDGLGRNTFTKAKKASVIVEKYPFKDAPTFEKWLDKVTRNKKTLPRNGGTELG